MSSTDTICSVLWLSCYQKAVFSSDVSTLEKKISKCTSQLLKSLKEKNKNRHQNKSLKHLLLEEFRVHFYFFCMWVVKALTADVGNGTHDTPAVSVVGEKIISYDLRKVCREELRLLLSFWPKCQRSEGRFIHFTPHTWGLCVSYEPAGGFSVLDFVKSFWSLTL